MFIRGIGEFTLWFWEIIGSAPSRTQSCQKQCVSFRTSLSALRRTKRFISLLNRRLLDYFSPALVRVASLNEIFMIINWTVLEFEHLMTQIKTCNINILDGVQQLSAQSASKWCFYKSGSPEMSPALNHDEFKGNKTSNLCQLETGCPQFQSSNSFKCSSLCKSNFLKDLCVVPAAERAFTFLVPQVTKLFLTSQRQTRLQTLSIPRMWKTAYSVHLMMCEMCEQLVSNVWKRQKARRHGLVYLQCSSGKWSPERRAKEETFRFWTGTLPVCAI